MTKEWDILSTSQVKYHDFAYPLVSIIIPTYNQSQSLPTTLQSILEQDYPSYEIIVVDAASTDRTLEVVKSYRSKRVRILSVSDYSRYEMLNKGISHAKGEYINMLFPGDFYIHYQAIRQMIDLALDHANPHLVYCGCVLHEANTQIKALNRPLTLELLKSGRQPTSLQSCWIRSDTFRLIGKFPTEYTMRGGFDFFCRFCLADMRFVSTTRVLTDYDLRGTDRQSLFRHFWETGSSLYRRFGWAVVLRWLFFRQRDVSHYAQHWLRRLRTAFLGHSLKS